MGATRLLWVDDHAPALKGLIRPLERAGYAVDIATTIGAAIDYLRSDTRYDLLLMDVVLPLIGSLPAALVAHCDAVGHNRGEGFIAYARQELRMLLPIVVLTSWPNDQQLLARLAPYAVSRVLCKGQVTPVELKATIENVLDTVDTLSPIILSLRFGRRSDREAALVNASHLPYTPALQQALIDLINTERSAAVRSAAIKLMRAHLPTDRPAAAAGLVADAGDITAASASQRSLLLHERADLPVVEALTYRLGHAGLETPPATSVLYDDSASHGWPPTWLMEYGVVVLCLGPTSDGLWARPAVAAALEMGVRTRSCQFIPLLLPGATVPRRDWARPLYRLQWIDLRDGLANDVAISRLIAWIAPRRRDGGALNG